MYIYEYRFSPRIPEKGRDKWLYEYQCLMVRFFNNLYRNGLTLEGALTISENNGGYSCKVIAVDEKALEKRNFSYDTRVTLSKLTELGGEPQCVPLEKCVLPAHCECERSDYVVLQASAEWEGTPLMCGTCGKSVPLYRLVPDANEREFDDLYGWRRLYRGYMNEHIVGIDGIDYHESYVMLNECVSTLNLIGRRFAGLFEKFGGVPTYYPIFSRYDRIPDECPQCGKRWVNEYTDVIKFSHVCSACRLVSGALF